MLKQQRSVRGRFHTKQGLPENEKQARRIACLTADDCPELVPPLFFVINELVELANAHPLALFKCV